MKKTELELIDAHSIYKGCPLLGAHFIYEDCPSVKMQISGNCPVQVFGKIEGDNFYFRARWNGWRLEIYNGKNERKRVWQANGLYNSASWMPLDKALAIIGCELQKFWKQENGGAWRLIKKRFGEKVLEEFWKKVNEKGDSK